MSVGVNAPVPLGTYTPENAALVARSKLVEALLAAINAAAKSATLIPAPMPMLSKIELMASH